MTDVVIALVQKDLMFAFMQQANGVWRFPAGKVEVGEDFRAAVHRKLDDLSGLKVDTPIRLGMRESEHGTLHYYLCDWQEGELEARNPHKFRQAVWMPPERIFVKVGREHIFKPAADYLMRMR